MSRFEAHKAQGMVSCDGGSFAIVGFGGFVGMEDVLAEQVAAALGGLGVPPVPRKCDRCGGHVFEQLRGGAIVCRPCDGEEDCEEDLPA